LAARPTVALIDTLGDALPASAWRQPLPPPAPESESDEDNDQDQDQDQVGDDNNDDDDQRKCNDQKLGRCAKAYAKQLGLKGLPADPMEYAKALQAILAKYGKIGFKKICATGAKFGKCLGRQQSATCMTVKHLMELGLTKRQAIIYIVIGRELQFECTKGFRIYYDNFDCITNVQKRSNETFVKCQQDFDKKIKQDPKNVCKYSQQLVNCDVKPFAEKCKPQVGATVCQTFQVVFKTVLPRCQIKCNRDEVENDDILVPVEEGERVIQVDTDTDPDQDQMSDVLSV